MLAIYAWGDRADPVNRAYIATPISRPRTRRTGSKAGTFRPDAPRYRAGLRGHVRSAVPAVRRPRSPPGTLSARPLSARPLGLSSLSSLFGSGLGFTPPLRYLPCVISSIELIIYIANLCHSSLLVHSKT